MMRFSLLVLVACSTSRSPPPPIPPPGSHVELRGRISDTPWAHMMTNVDGKQPAYFDHDGDRQTVIYWSSPPRCPNHGDIVIAGTVIEARGESKRRPSDDKTP